MERREAQFNMFHCKCVVWCCVECTCVLPTSTCPPTLMDRTLQEDQTFLHLNCVNDTYNGTYSCSYESTNRSITVNVREEPGE